MSDFYVAMHAISDFHEPMYARGMTGPFGKYTREVKTLIDEETHAKWLRVCGDKVTPSELLRDYVYRIVHGMTPAEIVAHDRRALLPDQGRIDAIIRVPGDGA